MTNDARDEFGDVDDVLGDLDRALSVEPSPAVTARVRRAIEAQSPRGSRWVRWTMAAAAVGTAGLALVVQTRPEPATEPDVPPAVVADAGAQERSAPRAAISPAASEASPARDASSPATRGQRVGQDRAPEPEVLIAPDVQAAFDELLAGVAAGRITAAAFTTQPVEITPATITPTVIEIQPFGSEDQPPASPTGERRSFLEQFASTAGSSTETRSTL